MQTKAEGTPAEITIVLTALPVLYVTTPWLTYFVARSLCLFTPFTFCANPPAAPPSGNCRFVLCICESVSVFVFVLFCFLDSTYK